MARKGNLIYNGDFETGTVEGWIHAPKWATYKKASIEVDSVNQRTGSYCGKVIAGGLGVYGIGYDLLLDFEEYPAYYFVAYGKLGNMVQIYPFVEFYDEGKKVIYLLLLGFSRVNEYVRFAGYITNLGLGRYARFYIGGYGLNAGDACYWDDISVTPVRDIRGISIEHHVGSKRYTGNASDYLNLFFPRPMIIRDLMLVSNTSGTSPTLDVSIQVYSPRALRVIEEKAFPQVTADGTYYLTFETSSFGFLGLNYKVGGTKPRFDVEHYLQISLR